MSGSISDDPQERLRKSCEIRLGLVLYGGVSLAVYINGVAREFFRAVRGNGVYKLIKALTDSDIVVDIISGTSAGGINGILLAYALVNEKSFADAAELWRRDGDIRSLLRSPNGDENAHSLLDSEGYYQSRLEDAFRSLPDYLKQHPDEDLFNSKIKELDLFVTGTDVDGNLATFFDDAGHPIDIKDHRSVFLLKYRPWRKETFNPCSTTYKALAKLARITSCFPAAFAPVSVSFPIGAEKQRSPEDDLLQQWGKLKKEATFLDGGVIDNKPFTHTLREIFSRGTTRQVERKVFYVEPDPEHFQQPARASQPNFLQAILASLIGIPSYESISDDLKFLGHRNRKLKQYSRLLEAIERQNGRNAGATKYQSGKDRQPLSEIYQRSRLISLSERVVQGILRKEGRDVLLPDSETRRFGSALFAEFDKFQSTTKKEGGQDSPAELILSEFDVYFRLRRLYRLVYLLYDLLYGGKQQIDGMKPVEPTEREILGGLWQSLNRQIELLEMVRARMESAIDDIDLPWEKWCRDFEEKCKLNGIESPEEAFEQAAFEIWWVVGAALKKMLDEGGHGGKWLKEIYERSLGQDVPTPESEALTKLNEILLSLAAQTKAEAESGELSSARTKIEAESGELDPDNKLLLPKTLLALTDAYERKLLDKFLSDDSSEPSASQILRHAYENFEAIDELLLPIELIGDLYEKDQIETIRISPADADKGFSNKGLSDKVSGDALYHFASFFKRSWRANDILWGRLDGLCQITETLLSRDKLGALIETEAGRKRLGKFFFKDGDWVDQMKPSTLFPNAGTITQNELYSWINDLLLGNDNERKNALSEAKFSDNIKLLIEAAQLEILHEEVPSVISDALEEQTLWNQFHFTPTKQPRYPLSKEQSAEKALVGVGNSLAYPTLWNRIRVGLAKVILRRVKLAHTPLQPKNEQDYFFSFRPSGGEVDKFVGAVAAAAQAYTKVEQLKDDGKAVRPRATKLGRFFRAQYRVGTEELLRDLPPLVLMEMLAVGLLVLRNCILTIFGPNKQKVTKSKIYLFGVDLPLRAFYATVVFLRRAPRYSIALYALIAGVSVVLLGIGVIWRREILHIQAHNGGQLNLWHLFLFIGLPMSTLVGMYATIWHRKINRWHWTRLLRNAFFAALIISPVLLIILLLFSQFELFERNLQSFYHLSVAAFNSRLWNLTWLAHTFTWIAFAGLLLALPVALWWLRRMNNTQSLNEEELRYALLKFFPRDDLKRIARRLLKVKPDNFENWIKPAKMVKWKDLERELAKCHVPKDEIQTIAQKLKSKRNGEVYWEDARLLFQQMRYHRASNERMFDEADLGALAGRLGITEKEVDYLISQAKHDAENEGGLSEGAKKKNSLEKLEEAMRAINPEALR